MSDFDYETRIKSALASPSPDTGRERVIEQCAQIALTIDSGRGNEKEIARAIRALAQPRIETTEGEPG